jgi:Kef-type K+ transport system membrane component KefB
VLGEIIAGILLGPTLFHGKITATLFPITLRPPLSALANLGVVMFMFAVGYLLDLRLIRGRERVAVSVSVSSIILPLTLGVGLGAWLASRHHVHQVLPFALFVGTAMSVTAFPVLARILTDRGMHRTRIGSIALASAATDDVLAWSLLAVVVAIAGAGGQQFRLLLAPIYVGVMFGLVRPLLRRLVDICQRRGRRRAGVRATSMNTRGLTGIVILSVGLQLHILDQSLYSLMIVMAIVTTVMAGPLLHLIYPYRFMGARHRGGGPCRARDRRGAPDPGADRGAGDRRSAR